MISSQASIRPKTNKHSGRSTQMVAKQTAGVRINCGYWRQAGPRDEAGLFSADFNKCQQDFLENICCSRFRRSPKSACSSNPCGDRHPNCLSQFKQARNSTTVATQSLSLARRHGFPTHQNKSTSEASTNCFSSRRSMTRTLDFVLLELAVQG